MTVRAVLFDFDGTLADSEPLITASLIHALGTRGHVVTEERVRHIFGPPLPVMVRALAGDLGDAEVASIADAYFEHFNARLSLIQPIEGAADLLDALAGAGVPVAMVTNKVEASARRQLAAMRWDDRFEVVVGADTVGRAKPAADPAVHALARLGVEASDAAFVGDQDPDVGCGLAAGCGMVIGVAFGRPAEMLAAAGATHVARDLHEVRQLLLDGTGA